MMPVWTLKLGAVAVTLASTAGFWRYVTAHVHPVKAPLKPKVEQPADETITKADMGWDRGTDTNPAAAPAPAPVTVKKVVVIQSQVQSGAAPGANWVANRTGTQPVTNTHTS